MADTKLQELTGTPPYSPFKLPGTLDGIFTASLAAARGRVYELWVTGRNSAGDGPASNKIPWTAPV